MRGVGDPDLAVEHPDDQRDMLAFQPDAPFFQQFNHAPDVVRSAGDAGADQTPGGIHPELLVGDDGSGVELLGQMAGRERVGAVKPLLVGQSFVSGILHDGLMLPAEGCGLFPPDPLFVGLHLAEPTLGTCRLNDVELLVDREVVPVEALAFREPLGLVQDLLVALAEGPIDVFRNRGDDDRLLVGVVVHLDPEPPQLVGQDRLEVGTELLDARVGQRPCVQRADAALRRDHQVHQKIVDVHMRIAGDRRIEQVGLPAGSVLHLQCGTGRVMAEADPSDRPRVGPIFAAGAFASPTQYLGHVAHGPVAGAIDGVPEGGALRGRGGELGREADRFVRTEHQVETGELARVPRPRLASIGAPCLEQARHFGVAGHLSGVDANCPCEDRRHVRPPGRPAVATRVVGGQPPTLFQLSPGCVHRRRVDRLGRVLGEVAEDEVALRGRGDLPEVHHARAIPFILACPSGCSVPSPST